MMVQTPMSQALVLTNAQFLSLPKQASSLPVVKRYNIYKSSVMNSGCCIHSEPPQQIISLIAVGVIDFCFRAERTHGHHSVFILGQSVCAPGS